uniref:Uncharacterized protein n=1 Tax=Magallana gigas TaxID=29159 RepID=K1PTJ5_MAGGI
MGSCPTKQTTNRQFAAALRERSTIKSAFNRATNNNDEDMLIPPGPNTRTKDDILPSPEILELIDVHVSEVNLCDFKEGE